MGAEIILVALWVGLMIDMIVGTIIRILDPDQEYDPYGY